jgi:hypothetical protein
MYNEIMTSGYRDHPGPWPHNDEEGKWCNCITY